jgi:hypothetical protein
VPRRPAAFPPGVFHELAPRLPLDALVAVDNLAAGLGAEESAEADRAHQGLSAQSQAFER